MIGRLLVAVRKVESDRSALESAAAIASSCGAVTRVVHVRAGDCVRAVRYFESTRQAWDVVDEAVFDLRMGGVGAGGEVVRAPVGRVAEAIDEAARAWDADAIVLGPSRRTVLSHVLQRKAVRKRLTRISAVPVISAPLHPVSVASVPEAGLIWVRPRPAGEPGPTAR